MRIDPDIHGVLQHRRNILGIVGTCILCWSLLLTGLAALAWS